MIEYTEINLISKHWNMQPAKLLIKINIFCGARMLLIQPAEKSRLLSACDVTY